MGVVYAPFSNSMVQLGRETTAGTAVAATTVWRGAFAMLEDARERVIVEEQIGAFMQAERSYDARLLARWAQPETPLTFEQVCHILEAGVKTATPTGIGPYVYEYNYPYTGTTLNTIKTYTIESGNRTVSEDHYEMEYSFVEDFTFSGRSGETWMMSSNWTGRQMTQLGMTGSLTAPTVNDAPFNYTKLYIDASAGTIGTTQVLGVLMAADVRVRTGLMPVPVGDGNLYFAAHKWTQPEITFSLTLELENSSVVADERDAYRANNIRLIQLLCERSAGLQFQIDMAAKYDSFGSYENSDGNATVTIEGHAVASAADTLSATFTVTNGVATVP